MIISSYVSIYCSYMNLWLTYWNQSILNYVINVENNKPKTEFKGNRHKNRRRIQPYTEWLLLIRHQILKTTILPENDACSMKTYCTVSIKTRYEIWLDITYFPSESLYLLYSNITEVFIIYCLKSWHAQMHKWAAYLSIDPVEKNINASCLLRQPT